MLCSVFYFSCHAQNFFVQPRTDHDGTTSGTFSIHYNSSKCPTDTSTGRSDGGSSLRAEGGLALCSVLVHHPPVAQEQPEDRGPNPVYHSICSISSKAFLSTKGLIGRGETRKKFKRLCHFVEMHMNAASKKASR